MKGKILSRPLCTPLMWFHALVQGSRFELTLIYTILGIPQMPANLLNFNFKRTLSFIYKNDSSFLKMHCAKCCWKMYEGIKVRNVNGPSAPGELKYSIMYVADFVLHIRVYMHRQNFLLNQNIFTHRRVYDWHTYHIVLLAIRSISGP